MRTDTECDLALEAANDVQRRAITGLRDRLIAEHLGSDARTVADAVAEHGSLLRAVEALSEAARRLRPIALPDLADDDQVAATVSSMADPERPIDLSGFVGDRYDGHVAKRSLGRMGKLGLAALLAVTLTMLWTFTPLSTLTQPDELRSALQTVGDAAWMPVAVPLIFVLGGLVAFPITALIAGTGLVFEPLPALAYTLSGTLLSASVTFHVGHLTGRALLRRLLKNRLNRISRTLGRHGLLSVAAMRMIPIAPFTLINMVAGASQIRFIDYLLGTLIGMGPGIVVMVLFGRQVGQAITDPSPARIAVVAAVATAWLALSFALQHLATRLRGGDE